jgi:hypothetical protein
MQFVPFSYFCTCWNVRPGALPSLAVASISAAANLLPTRWSI